MQEAWVSESLTFGLPGIKHAITNKFGWLEPSKFICDGSTFGVQIVLGQSAYILVKEMLLPTFPIFL